MCDITFCRGGRLDGLHIKKHNQYNVTLPKYILARFESLCNEFRMLDHNLWNCSYTVRASHVGMGAAQLTRHDTLTQRRANGGPPYATVNQH